MKWYSGSIAQAIQYSHTTKAIFCVFVLGTDDVSKQLETALEDGEVAKLLGSDQFVCIRIAADSQEHKQFSEIYTNVISPSIYCITDKGVPVEIITQLLSPDELTNRLGAAFIRHRKVIGLPAQNQESSAENVSPSAGTSSSAAQPTSSNASLPVESVGLTAANEAVTAAEALPQLTLDERIERARKLALAKQQQKLEQEKEDAKKLERERRTAGKGMAELKRWQEEQETKRALEERKKDKIQEQQLRQRLKEQIAQDRAERNARSNLSYVNDGAEPQTVPVPVRQSSPINYSGKARIQFRMPDGSSVNHGFEQDSNLGQVRNFLIDNNHVPFRQFSLWVAYPRREFTTADYNSSLQELGLLPSAALLVLPVTATRIPIVGGVTSNVWTLITALLGYVVYPLTLIYTYFRGALPAPPPPGNKPTPAATKGRGNTLGGSRRDNPGGPPGSGSGSSSQGPSGTPKNTQSGETQGDDNRSKNSPKTDNFRGSEGNVHRLRTSESDSEDEKATWNGNSTQQM